MADVADTDEQLFETAEWEPWLATRFVAYLLRDSAGRSRPADDVERALARLSGDAGALARLGALAFLTDPNLGVAQWLLNMLPAFLRRIRVRSERVLDTRRGSARGALDWGRTLTLRANSLDDTWAVSRSHRRTTETPELVTVRRLLDHVARAATSVAHRGRPSVEGWSGRVAELGRSAAHVATHSVFRDVPVRVPRPNERMVARSAHDPAVREAARLLDAHDELLPRPRADRLRDALARHALVPLIDNVRFQLFAMLALVDALDRLLPGAQRRDAIVESGRGAVVSWTRGNVSLALHYDQAAERGRHVEVMSHYFGRVQPLRPDIRLVFTIGPRSRELLVDAKRSLSARYLAEAHHKMHGYMADRPAMFADTRPSAIVVCPVARVSPASPDHDVVFVGLNCCGAESTLDAPVGQWLQCAARVIDASAPS